MIDRIEAQADVIDAVNKTYGRNQELTGLTRAAIEDWHSRTGVGQNAVELKEKLIEISHIIGSLVDRSNPPKYNNTELYKEYNELLEEIFGMMDHH